MKSIKLNNLFDAARQDRAPAVDVADSVLARLTGQQRGFFATVNRSLMWLSVGASATAAGILLAAFITWRQHAGAVNEILNVVAWVAQ